MSTGLLERRRHGREAGPGAQTLRDPGVTTIRLLASKARTYVGLGGFGIESFSTDTLEGQAA